MNQIFFGKSGSVSHFVLSISNFWPKIRKILRAVFEKNNGLRKKVPKMAYIRNYWMNQIFPGKTGSVSLFVLTISNSWPKIIKIVRAVTEIWWSTPSRHRNCQFEAQLKLRTRSWELQRGWGPLVSTSRNWFPA